jgi:hypothetical protein
LEIWKWMEMEAVNADAEWKTERQFKG